MNAKVKNDRVMLVALLCSVCAILFIFVGVVWQSKNQSLTLPKMEDLKVEGHTWGTNVANITFITLSVRNTGTLELSVGEVRVNGTVVNTVAYGGSFTGNTHTLETGAYGTITITYSFKSGVNHEIDVVSARGNKWTYHVTAP
jgi:hypothetical protein